MQELSIVFSVVSYDHQEFILQNLLENNNSLPKNIKLVITDLAKDEIFKRTLIDFHIPNLIYHTNPEIYGYGKNNNIVFNTYAQESDIFVVCNPDVEIDLKGFNQFIDSVTWKNKLITVKTEIPGGIKNNNIRRFFNPLVWMGSFLKILDFNHWYYGSQINEEVTFDWCNGAFMVFDTNSYKKLRGFDEGYFMYIEDTDICYRCDKLAIEKKYYPTFAIKHFGHRRSKNIFNKHFIWILRSIMRYYWKIYTHKM